jgi:hypothetical protein
MTLADRARMEGPQSYSSPASRTLEHGFAPMDLAVFGANWCTHTHTHTEREVHKEGRGEPKREGEASEEGHGREAPIMECRVEMAD